MYQKGLMQLLTLRKDLRSMHKYLILSGLFILVQFVFGQGISPYCAHEEFHQKLLKTSPEYRKAFLEMERDIYEYTVRRDQSGPYTDFSRIVYTIPVVIHLVVPPGTPIGQLVMKIAHLLAEELKEAERKITVTAQQTAHDKVGVALHFLVQNYGYERDQSTLNISIKREELANLAGTTRETATRQLYKLQDEGIIKIAGKKIRILDETRLSKFMQ